jgi:hypothetical protein
MHLTMFNADRMNTHLFGNEFNWIIEIIEITRVNETRSNFEANVILNTYTISQFSIRPDGLVTYAVMSNGDVPKGKGEQSINTDDRHQVRNLDEL